MSLLLLSKQDIKKCITMPQAIDAMESAFLQLAKHKVKLPLRTGIAIEEQEALTLIMPGYLEETQALGLKVVSIFPNNIAKNKPAINGFIMLLDASTGEPKVLMEAGYLTALRTGAVSGLATKYFASDNASHLALIGSGVQAITQLEAVAAVRDIKKISIWSRNLENAKLFANAFEQLFDIQVQPTISAAVKHADIICTATGSTEALIHLKDLQPHAHINAIGSHSKAMQEIATDALEQGLVIADQLEAVLAESGEIHKAIELKKLNPNSILEIGTWLLDKKPDFKDKLTIFKSVGLAIQDLSVGDTVYQNALKNKLGTSFSL